MRFKDVFDRSQVICEDECFADGGVVGAEALVAKGVEEDGFLFRQSINFADNDAELVCGVDAETNGVGRSAKNFERKVVCLRVRDAVFADVFYGAILCSNGVFVFQASKANKTTW